jgi:hypothetical protein
MDFLKNEKKQRNILLICLGVLIFLLLRSCGSTGLSDIEKNEYENNIAALNDNIRTYEDKNGKLVSEKNALLLEKKELKKYSKDLENEVKHLKDNPITITRVETKLKHDTIYIKSTLDTNNVMFSSDSLYKTAPFIWKNDTSYDKFNYRMMNGRVVIEVGPDLYVNLQDFTIDKDEIGLSLTTGITESDDNQLEIFIKSDYPGFTPTKIDGALIDPTKSKVIKSYFPKKRWGVGLNAGYGLYLDPGLGRTGTGIILGASVTYDLFQWNGKR